MKDRIISLAAFSILTVTIFILENFLPKPLPFFRLGLANIFILLVLWQIGLGPAMILVLSKVVLGSLFSGLLFTPVVIFSLSGSTLSVIIMYLAIKSKIDFSLIGVSILGAIFHNISQLFVAYFTFIKRPQLFSLLPLLLLIALVSGCITGFFAHILNERLNLENLLQKNT